MIRKTNNQVIVNRSNRRSGRNRQHSLIEDQVSRPIVAPAVVRKPGSRPHTWVAALVALLLLLSAPIASAQDCNHNGISDSEELYQAVHFQNFADSTETDFGLLPFPAGDVVISLQLDFASSLEGAFVSVRVNGALMGNVIDFVEPQDCGSLSGTMTIDKNVWLNAQGPDGVVHVKLTVSDIDGCNGLDRGPFLLEFDYSIDADCDDDGLLNVCEVPGCAASGFNNSCYPDTDGDGVMDPCDVCDGIDGPDDTDGDGVPDTCDECADQDDNQDCNLNGVKDCLELTDPVVFEYRWGRTDVLPCAGESLLLPDLPLPATVGDVTFTLIRMSFQGLDPGDSMDLYGNNVFLGAPFENLPDCTENATLTIPDATWNSAVQAGNGSVDLELRVPDDACATMCGYIPISIDWKITYNANYDTNSNGTADICPSDCAHDDTDSDGDHVADDCDQCPNTIAGHPYIDEVGCPYFVAKADSDADGDVDASDFGGFFDCDTGPGTSAGAGCDAYDYTSNGAVDLLDYLGLQDAASGPDVFAELEATGYDQPEYILVDDFTRFGGAMMTWDDAEEYCEQRFGTRLATIDPALSIVEQNERIDTMTALAETAGGYDVWIGMRFDPDSLDARYYWTDGQPLLPITETGGISVTHWVNGESTPNPDVVIGGQGNFCVALWSQSNYEWLNTDCVYLEPDLDIRACLCDRPDDFVVNENQVLPDTLDVQLTSDGSNSASVVAGGTLTFDVRGMLGGAVNQGLAGFAFDLSFDGGDLTQASIAPGMENFAAPNGYNNPDGFGGKVVGGDLIQVGGGQNTVNNTGPGGPSGTVTTGLGQTEVILATGTITAPATPGTYTLSLSNLAATTINPGASAPAWKCEPANAGTITNLTITVLSCTGGDADNDGVCDEIDTCIAVNDDCASATSIGEGSFTGCSVGAAPDGTATCANTNSSPDVWYLYTATCDGFATAGTCGATTTFDTVLSVFDGCGGSELSCNDDGCGGTARTSLVTWPVSTGGQYLVRVSGYGGASGDFELNVSCSTNAANDNCANATAITPGSYSGSTTNATIDGPGPCLTVASRDVWYVYTNDTGVDVEVTADLCSANTTFDTVLGVYDACGGSEIACNDDNADFCAANESASKLTWTVPCNATHWIQVASYGDVPGDFELNFSVNPVAGADSDGDGVGDACDVCAGFDDKVDADKDGVPDGCDLCPGFDDGSDADGDGIPDGCDNCPALSNSDQTDSEAPSAALAPIATWHFDENSGSTATDVVAGHVGTLDGVVWNSAGRAGSALEFPAGGSTVNVPSSAGLGVLYQLTISLWVKPSAFPVTFNRLVTRPNEIYVLRLDGRKPNFYVKKGGVLTGARANVLIDANRWTHLAAVWDGLGDGVLRIYIDGVEATGYDIQGTVLAPLDTSTAGLSLGNPGTARFEGLMDELSIFNRALSLSQIQALMTKGPGDGVGDTCDVCVGTDETGDSDGDGSCDDLDMCPGFDDALDTDGDGVPDDCDLCPVDNPDDTDGDGVCDSNDICPGGDDNLDTDGDNMPDACDPCPLDEQNDTDGDGICDSGDVCPGFDDHADNDGDGVPDGCDLCQGNDATGDTDGDGVCDDVDPCPNDNPDDTDGDSVCDSVDTCPGFDDNVDTDADGVPDGCDVCPGGDDNVDGNGNGVPDDCDLAAPLPAPAPHDILKNRYISIAPLGADNWNFGLNLDIRVTMTGTQVSGVTAVGSHWWANEPDENCISVVGSIRPASAPNWDACPVLHLTGCPIIPTSTYDIVMFDGDLASSTLVGAATQARPGTKWHGDVVGSFNGFEWSAPQGVVNIDDAVAGIKTFQDPNAFNATHVSVTDVHPNQSGTQINKIVNFDDVFVLVLGFKGQEYPGWEIELCPDP